MELQHAHSAPVLVSDVTACSFLQPGADNDVRNKKNWMRLRAEMAWRCHYQALLLQNWLNM